MRLITDIKTLFLERISRINSKDVSIIGSQLNKMNEYPVSPVLDVLLKDRTTGKNIIFATDEYPFAYEREEITPKLVSGEFLNENQPRVEKAKENQAASGMENG